MKPLIHKEGLVTQRDKYHRTHILVNSSLISLLLEILNKSDNINFGELELYCKNALNDNLNEESCSELASSALSKEIGDKIDTLKTELREKSRISKLWLLYMRYIYIVMAFIFAERKSNWELHPHLLPEILNPLASTYHINYAITKRVPIYIYKRWENYQKHIHSCMQKSLLAITQCRGQARTGYVFGQILQSNRPRSEVFYQIKR